ncbi:hypothetical protein O3P69_009472 [Scylla paramamosain]|uniref:Uncharacterized protein n=1 Tax=Scylla paramamosain TaxID=85552 RepID=A0AAW0SV59_SCYPA
MASDKSRAVLWRLYRLTFICSSRRRLGTELLCLKIRISWGVCIVTVLAHPTRELSGAGSKAVELLPRPEWSFVECDGLQLTFLPGGTGDEDGGLGSREQPELSRGAASLRLATVNSAPTEP